MTSWPPVLVMADVAKLLGLPTEEAARKFVARHGVPHAKVGRVSVVLLETLISYLKTRETVEGADVEAAPTHHDGDALQAAATAVRRRERLHLHDAARRLAGKVAETLPKD